MLIQVYVKNEPVEKCDLLIAREDAVVSVPVSGLKSLGEAGFDVALVKAQENMGMKAAVLAARFIASAEAVSSPVYIACPDKAILDGMCSMEYAGPAGGPILLAPYGAKPAAQPRTRSKPKPKAPAAPAPDGADADQAGKPSGTPAEPPADAPADPPADAPAGPDDGQPAGAAPQDGEIVLDNGGAGEPGPEKPDPSLGNARKIMSILKEQGVPAGQIPGVLEALREAMDASITLPMQVRLKLSKDGAVGDMDPDKTAALVAPRFDELKGLLKEIDEHNGGGAGTAGGSADGR